MIELQKYCFWMGQFPQRRTMELDLSRAVEAEFLSFLGSQGKEPYREHILHKGNTFLYGLWLYDRSESIQAKHKELLEHNPSPAGCVAEISPNKDLNWQFFQQWFITSSHHDMGRILGLDVNLAVANQIVHGINKLQKESLRASEKLQKIKCNPIRLILDPYEEKVNLDIAPLYHIKYKKIAEDHIDNNFWEVCHKRIIELGQGNPLDHGINGAKILIKLANFDIKMDEIEELGPWKRYSYRNYILPSIAIAKHNIEGNKRSIADIIDKGFDGLEITVKKEKFDEDFLTTLLVCSDALAEFERIGGKGDIRLGMDFELKMSEGGEAIGICVTPLQKKKGTPLNN